MLEGTMANYKYRLPHPLHPLDNSNKRSQTLHNANVPLLPAPPSLQHPIFLPIILLLLLHPPPRTRRTPHPNPHPRRRHRAHSRPLPAPPQMALPRPIQPPHPLPPPILPHAPPSPLPRPHHHLPILSYPLSFHPLPRTR